MSYLNFDKTQLVNLEYSLPKEVLLSNESGVYCSTTIIGCNTRKYHGLLVAPLPSVDGFRHVLLSSLHETVIQHGQEFNLGITKYPGEYNPKGHKYARWFELDPMPRIVYRVGGVVIQKELLLADNEPRIMIRYSLLEARSSTKLRIKPFLAFRNIHKLSKSNLLANKKVSIINNGVKIKLYREYPDLFMQTSKKGEFVAAPDWYLNIHYSKEQVRGYEFLEDLVVPGYFEMDITKGQSIVFSAGLNEIPAMGLSKRFLNYAVKIDRRKDFYDWLGHAARTFIRKYDIGLEILPGYHWFGRWGRYSMIPLPGISTAVKEEGFTENVLDSLIKRIKGGLLPDHSLPNNKPVYEAADTSLWFIWALQHLSVKGGRLELLYGRYKDVIAKIIAAYINGQIPGVKVHINGLIHAFLPGKALTWMDSYMDGKPVTQRPGYAVEINALWYNAICYALKGARAVGDNTYIAEWSDVKSRIDESFVQVFWNEQGNTLYDYVHLDKPNEDVRPNMLLAASMKYTPLSEEQVKAVLDQVRQELLIPKGLRSLSPRSEDFKASYEGDHILRDMAYHQGTVWPWLLGPFAEAWLRLYGKSGVSLIKGLLHNFEEDLMEHGVGTISEVYDGNPPHRPCGAIAFAPSVGELLRIKYLISKY